MTTRAYAFVAAICSIVLPPGAIAQQAITSAALTGVVRDPAGAPVASIEVTMHREDRNQLLSARSDGEGRFRFLYLPPGEYTLAINDSRFRGYRAAVEVATGQLLEVTITLDLATRAESLQVTATVPMIETVRTQVASTVGQTAVDSLPLNGRNYLDLALLAPGVSRTNTGAPQPFAETSAVPGTGISVAGQRNLNNTFLVDGHSANDDAAGLSGTFFSQEVIREFQVITAGGSAEYGRASSGIINVATRSGSNQWHGRLYSYARNQRLDARNALALSKDPLTQAQYGASAGGPLRRDRVFLFSNFEQTRRQAAGFVTITPGNVVAINRALDSLGYPGPRVTTGQFPTGWDTTNYFARADHQLSSTHQLIVRYSLYDIASENARSAGGLNATSRGARLDDRDQTVAISEVATLSPRDLNEARVQFTRSTLAAPGNDLTGPAVSIAGVANFGASTTSPTERDLTVVQASDTATLDRGRHVLKAGGDFLFNRLRIDFPGSQIAPVYAFSSIATLEAGRYTTYQQAFGETTQKQSNPNFGLFAQDEWRVRPGLTLNFGLRYDFQRLAAPIRVGGNTAPRFGLAWSPAANTVLRASYGLYYDRVPLRATSNALQRDGTKYRTALLAFGQPGAPAFPLALGSFPAGQFINITTIDPNIRNSYAHHSSLQVERGLGRTTAISAGVEWVRALHLIPSRNVNVPTLSAAEANRLGIPNLGRPDSRYGNVSRYEGSGDSYFYGLLTSIKTRPWQRGEVSVAYTFSKAIDNVGNFFFSAPQNNANLRDDRGLSDNDQRHRLTVAAVLDFPVSGQGTGSRILGGWQFSPLFRYTSALPYNVQLNFDRNNDTSVNDRPEGIGRNTARGFDYASFDVRLMRRFRIHERVRLDGVAEAFNLLNRVNRAAPNNVVGASPAAPLPSFGRATAVYDPRQLQFALRLSF